MHTQNTERGKWRDKERGEIDLVKPVELWFLHYTRQWILFVLKWIWIVLLDNKKGSKLYIVSYDFSSYYKNL